jgi:hypothetical protein
MARILLIAPHWTQSTNVARRRLVDMQRWLQASGHTICVVSAGERSHGEEIAVEDPRAVSGGLRRVEARRFARLRRWSRELRYLPDEGMPWAERVQRDRRVLDAASRSDLIVSSSPPESAHMAAHGLAARFAVPHLADLQDGWVDEPLRLSMQEFALRRWAEARLERRILSSAASITVTTDVWRDRLAARYPELESRIHTVRLAPPQVQLPPAVPQRCEGRLQLLHAGSFTLSHHRRRIELLLQPLLDAAASAGQELRARVLLLGDLHPAELAELSPWQQRFAAYDWRLEHAAAVPQQPYFDILAQQHGLLLLSASMGALPSKLFEYLALGRPILALTLRGSAMWTESERCPAAIVADYRVPHDPAVLHFLREAAQRQQPHTVPAYVGEAELRDRFLACVAPLLRDAGGAS